MSGVGGSANLVDVAAEDRRVAPFDHRSDVDGVRG
jgi:hypothetical protein